jgi:hypothetical protein
MHYIVSLPLATQAMLIDVYLYILDLIRLGISIEEGVSVWEC